MLTHHSSRAARSAGITYHLVPSPVWEAHRSAAAYLPEAYAADGFIHCTDGLDALRDVANLFYTDDKRPFTVLVLEVADLNAPVRYEDPDKRYPHIYGPLNVSAVRGELAVERDADGMFVGFREPSA